MNTRGWYLDCGGCFHADVYSNSGQWCLTLNMHPIGKSSDPEKLKREAERHIVAKVRKMIPAYRVIIGRAKASEAAFAARRFGRRAFVFEPGLHCLDAEIGRYFLHTCCVDCPCQSLDAIVGRQGEWLGRGDIEASVGRNCSR